MYVYYTYIYIYIYILYIYIIYILCIYIYIYINVIQGKNNQNLDQNISAIVFINSCQHLQFMYNA